MLNGSQDAGDLYIIHTWTQNSHSCKFEQRMELWALTNCKEGYAGFLI
jgi:hypothetical protein